MSGKFKLLHEEVVAKDAFKHNTHENAADTIAELIKREACGATVGLEGPWGGGKSTVLHILRQKLLRCAHVFLFDAWAHEGDCLRQVFLSSMIADFLSSGKDPTEGLSVDAVFLNNKAEIISGRKKVSKINNHRKPTWQGIVAVGVAGFFAIGLSLVQLATDDLGDLNQPYACLCCLLCAMPFALSVLYWLVLGLVYKRWFDASDWAFLQTDSDCTVTQEVSDSVERTSVEFSRMFAEIMERITSDNPGMKFVIAIDNLDRIPQENALALWSTMQTFLQKRSGLKGGDDKWFDRLWLLVPYDPEGIAHMWAGDVIDAGAAHKKANSFMDKSFQVRVEVPLPVLTDWEDFAHNQFKAAFGDGCKDEQSEAIRILKIMRQGVASIPTPREIKTFVNQFAILLEQFEGLGISASVLAAYAVRRFVDTDRLTVEQVRKMLVNDDEKLIGQKSAFLPADWKQQFAGVVFGVDPKCGMQLLLEPVIVEAMEDPSGEKFKGLVSLHGDAVWMVFESMLSNRYVWGREEDVESFVDILSGASGVNADELRSCETLKKRSGAFVEKIVSMPNETLQVFIPSDEGGIARVMNAIHSSVALLANDQLQALFRRVMDAADYRIGISENLVEIKLGRTVADIVSAFPEVVRSEYRSERLGTAAQLAAFCATIPDDEYLCAKWFKPDRRIANSLPSLYPPNQQADSCADAVVRYLIEGADDIDWTGVIAAIKAHVCQNRGWVTSERPSDSALKSLLWLAGVDKKCRAGISDILGCMEFWNFIGSKPNERARMAALLLAACRPDEVDSLSVQVYSNSQNGITLARKTLDDLSAENVGAISGIIQSYGLKSSLRNFWWRGSHSIYGALVEEVMRNPNENWLLSRNDPLDNVWVYRQHLEKTKAEDRTRLLREYLQFSDEQFSILNVLARTKFKEEERHWCMPDFCSVVTSYAERRDVGDNIWKSYQKDSTEEEFVTYIEMSEFVDFVRNMRRQDERRHFGFTYYKALKRIFAWEKEEESEDAQKTRESFLKRCDAVSAEVLIAALEGKFVEKLKEDISLKFISDDSLNLLDYQRLLKPFISIAKIPVEKLKDWAWKFVSEGDVDNLSWFLDFLDGAIRIKHYVVSDSDRELLKDPMQKLFEVQKGNSEVCKMIERMSDIYGINLVTDDSEEGPGPENAVEVSN